MIVEQIVFLATVSIEGTFNRLLDNFTPQLEYRPLFCCRVLLDGQKE